jgi:hypothetical protein
MQKTIIIILGLVLSLSSLFAGDFIIGAGTGTQNQVPVYGYANFGWSKFFYDNAELQAAGYTEQQTIERIAFYVGNSQTDYVMDNQQIYMGYFYDSQYSSASYQNPLYHSLVFSGSIAFNGPGWLEITLDTPYTWNPSPGWNLEILWENRDGSRIGGPPNFRFTATDNYSAVYKTGTSFSTTSGTRSRNHRPNIWLMSSPTEPPPPASALSPLDAALEVPIDTILRWEHNGGMPNSYNLWLGTDNPPSNLVNGLNMAETRYTPAQRLDYATTYYWRVIPINDIAPAFNTPIWSFTTMDDPSITDYPHLETFDGTFPPTGWTHYSGVLSDPITFGNLNGSQWAQDDWLNYPGADKAARINIWGNMSGYLVSPLFNVPSDNYVLKIDAAVLRYNQTPEGTPPNYSNTDDQLAILIGDGFGWTVANVVREYNNNGSEYVLHDIPMTGETITIPLSGHTGRIRVAIFAGSLISNDDNDLMVNNFWIGDANHVYAAPEAEISLNMNGIPLLNWTAVPYARKYNIYKTDDPTMDYNLFKSISGTSLSLSPTESKAFFKITAE